MTLPGFTPMGLLWLLATLAAYGVSDVVQKKTRINPVVLSTAVLIGLLVATDTSYEAYFSGAWPLHFLLGAATVALAVPLHRHFAKVRRAVLPMLGAMLAGSLTSAMIAVGLAWVLGAPEDVLLALIPKSATTPLALGIAAEIGGPPPLTAGLVVATGITGAVLAAPVMRAMRLAPEEAMGFAIGVVAHGIGTARAVRLSEVAGTFSGLAMGLNGLGSALLIPLLFSLFAS
ncbi:MAG: hypothetical protein A2516_09675 [Alphaproteobacteria bacterium RIFOXYD12_FULL_60_8]|nr:MAG: hypothetical protein A2516_09675 [Alphaproteobacteria bacterium RIFOXYD12_FULL_60_8]